MAVLVTRPAPESEATADALHARGFAAVLAPVLAFQALPFRDEDDARYSGVILTSASAVRAVIGQPLLSRLVGLPAFTVGARTAHAARDAGFADITTADGDSASLRELIAQRVPARTRAPLLYLCGADLSRDLAAELFARGTKVVSLAVYRMAALDALTEAARRAFASNDIEAVLHYSQRSAAAFVNAVRGEGLEVTALALPQLCLSAQVATVLRDAGAERVIVAGAPNEPALLDALEHALRRSLRSP